MLDPNHGRAVRAVTVHAAVAGVLATADGRPIRLLVDVGTAPHQHLGRPVRAVAVQPGLIASDGQVCEAIAWVADAILGLDGRPVAPAGSFTLT